MPIFVVGDRPVSDGAFIAVAVGGVEEGIVLGDGTERIVLGGGKELVTVVVVDMLEVSGASVTTTVVSLGIEGVMVCTTVVVGAAVAPAAVLSRPPGPAFVMLKKWQVKGVVVPGRYPARKNTVPFLPL